MNVINSYNQLKFIFLFSIFIASQVHLFAASISNYSQFLAKANKMEGTVDMHTGFGILKKTVKLANCSLFKADFVNLSGYKKSKFANISFTAQGEGDDPGNGKSSNFLDDIGSIIVLGMFLRISGKM